MNFFKKFINKFKRKEEERECWYNNAHENKKRVWVPPIEGGVAGGSPNQLDYMTTNQIAKRNH